MVYQMLVAGDATRNGSASFRKTTMHATCDYVPKRVAGSFLGIPWVQLVIGIVCMACVASLQYGWTLFVNPIDARHHWGRAPAAFREEPRDL
jgi:hypothetical protein